MKFREKKIGNIYKYYSGNTSDYNKIIQLQEDAKKSYSGAFIVAFKGGKRISMTEALKSASN